MTDVHYNYDKIIPEVSPYIHCLSITMVFSNLNLQTKYTYQDKCFYTMNFTHT